MVGGWGGCCGGGHNDDGDADYIKTETDQWQDGRATHRRTYKCQESYDRPKVSASQHDFFFAVALLFSAGPDAYAEHHNIEHHDANQPPHKDSHFGRCSVHLEQAHYTV